MTAAKLLLSQARRLSRLQHSSFPLPIPFLPFHRSLSSSSSSIPPQTDSEALIDRPSQSQSVPVQPVSYAAKPKDPTSHLQQQEQPRTQVDKEKQEGQLRSQLDQILHHIPSPQAPRPAPEGPTPAPEGPPQSFSSGGLKNVPNIAPVSYPAVSYAPNANDPTPQLQQQEQEEQPGTEVDKEKQEEQLRSQLDQILNHIPSPQAPRPTPDGPPATPEGPPQSSWTREDLRYVKNVPNIAPVSYPSRVAPLPEDRVGVAEEGGEVKKEGVTEEMERESRQIDRESRVMRRHFRLVTEEEKVVIPFPMLIMPEKKSEKRPVLDLMDAIREVKVNAKAKFDETIEAHVRLGIDQKRSELIVRGTMALPHGAKKEVTVAVFAEGAEAEEARAAGADIVGGADLIEEIASTGKIDFDRCYSTHSFMKRLYKISKVLNQHGLMPNPKQGTVTKDVTKAVKEAKQGQVKFRMDKTSIVHVGVGKVSLSEEYLRDNVGSFMNALLQAKPAGLKKTSKYAGYVNSFHICSTMGPGFRVSVQSLSRAADHYSKVYLNA